MCQVWGHFSRHWYIDAFDDLTKHWIFCFPHLDGKSGAPWIMLDSYTTSDQPDVLLDARSSEYWIAHQCYTVRLVESSNSAVDLIKGAWFPVRMCDNCMLTAVDRLSKGHIAVDRIPKSESGALKLFKSWCRLLLTRLTKVLSLLYKSNIYNTFL